MGKFTLAPISGYQSVLTHERLPLLYGDPAQLNCAMTGTIRADDFEPKRAG